MTQETLPNYTNSGFRGRLIVFEGSDGVGKGTQIERAINYFVSKVGGDKVFCTKEPGGMSSFGDKIRDLIFVDPGMKKMAKNVVDLMYTANHIQNVEENILPALEAGKIVISDRFWYSELVYMAERHVDPCVSEMVYQTRGLHADALIILHGDPRVAYERANSRTETHQDSKAWNDVATLERIQRRYLQYYSALPETRLVCMDGLDADGVWGLVRPILSEVLRESNILEAR